MGNERDNSEKNQSETAAVTQPSMQAEYEARVANSSPFGELVYVTESFDGVSIPVPKKED